MTKKDFTLTETGFKGFGDEGLGNEGAAGALERAFAQTVLDQHSSTTAEGQDLDLDRSGFGPYSLVPGCDTLILQ